MVHEQPERTSAAPPAATRVARVVEAANRAPTRRRALKVAADALALATALVAGVLLRYDLQPPQRAWGHLALFAVFALVVFVPIASTVGLYSNRTGYGSLDEVVDLVRLTVVLLPVLVGADLLLDRLVPISVAIAAPVLSLVAMAAVRCGWRIFAERALRPDQQVARRVLVFGAGEGARQIVTAMLRSPHGTYLPVGLIDDDPDKRNLRIRGVAVKGARDKLREVAERSGAEVVLLAIPSAGAGLVREVQALLAGTELKLFVLPSVRELYGAQVGVSEIRPVTHADLLGRLEVDTDIEAIADYLTGRRVLVTGAGGSIGSELCRQIYRFAPAQLVMLDRDESALHAVQLSLEGRAMLDDRNLVVCDIRDRSRIEHVFEEHEPEVVFHAAALKHLPLLEMHPVEAVKTNVWGTQNLLAAARRHRTERFVNISTDKAAAPCSVLGYSKRVAERLTAEAAAATDGTFLSVRFGNVLGSRGSVLTAFEAQIAAGGPVTVTDPQVTRYFMTVEEAVQLVIQAGAVGRNGQALVLDMGEPVRIADVARRLIGQADRPIELVYTGLRPGEKLHEVLFGPGEVGERTSHPRISHVDVPPLDPALVDDLSCSADVREVTAGLARLARDGAAGDPSTAPTYAD